MATLRRAKKSRRTTSRRSKQQRFKARIKSRLWRAKKKLGERIRPQNTNAVYAISDKPMTNDEWVKRYVTPH